jgi:hypothetical protein
MYSGDDDDDEGEKRQEEIEGVRVPCRDAKRRVWQAIDLLKQEWKTHNEGPRRAAAVRQQSYPSSENPRLRTVGAVLPETGGCSVGEAIHRQAKEGTDHRQPARRPTHKAARDGGYELLEEFVFVDENYSGSRLLDRPGLERLRDLASEGAFEAVLVCSPDRLARQYAYQVVVVEELQRAGCEVVFLNYGLGESPEERMLFLQIQGVFAEYERALIQERT